MEILHNKPVTQCDHSWISNSGFYINVCVTDEEPSFYPPMGLVQLEVCPDCGMVRLPNGAKSWRGIVVKEK